MPQAHARFGMMTVTWLSAATTVPNWPWALEKLYNEGLLYRTTMFSPPMYEAIDEGKIATFYIGAFWDEFMRKT